MKKILMAIFVLSFCSLSIIFQMSCQKKDDGANNTAIIDNTLFLRRWYYVSAISQGITYQSHACGNGNRDYLEFTMPNKYSEYHWKSSSDCSYIVTSVLTWVKNGNSIYFNYNGKQAAIAIISELTATNLKYVFTETDSQKSTLYVFQSY
jgi:hypothetical protein